jgi:hypothetical protein
MELNNFTNFGNGNSKVGSTATGLLLQDTWTEYSNPL